MFVGNNSIMNVDKNIRDEKLLLHGDMNEKLIRSSKILTPTPHSDMMMMCFILCSVVFETLGPPLPSSPPSSSLTHHLSGWGTSWGMWLLHEPPLMT